jgi:hypothetical protein
LIPRSLFAAIAIALSAPAALAQATPAATLERFVTLANTGQLTSPEGQAILTGEAKEMATEAKSMLPAADRIISVSPDFAAARFVLRGAGGDEADAYFYLQRMPSGWAVSAFRAMAMTGMDMMLLAEMKKQKTLSLEDQVRKRNLELILSPDSKLRAWFTANRPALEDIANAWTRLPAPRSSASSRDAEGVGASLPALGLSSVADLAGGVQITIGGTVDNKVGFLRAGPSGPPAIDPSSYIWLEDLGGGWFLYRAT